MKHYMALISIGVTADGDERAVDLANALAAQLTDRGVVIGHVEMVSEMTNGHPPRRVYTDPMFGIFEGKRA